MDSGREKDHCGHIRNGAATTRGRAEVAVFAQVIVLGAMVLVDLVLPGVLPASLSEVNGAKLWLKLGPLFPRH